MKRNQTNTSAGSGTMWLVVVLLILVVVGIGCWVWRHNHNWNWHKTSACAASDLQLSMGSSEGTAGTIYRHAVITNNGKSSCTLTGYPAAFLVDSHGLVLGGGAASNPLYAPSTITLAAHGTAHTVLGFPEAGNFDPGVCSAAAASLKLYLPGSTDFLQTALAEHSCPGFSVTAVQSGS